MQDKGNTLETIPKTTTVSAFKTSDGLIYESKRAAECHEEDLTFDTRYNTKRLTLNDGLHYIVLDIPEITNSVKKELEREFKTCPVTPGTYVIQENYDSKWGNTYHFYSIQELVSERQDDITKLVAITVQ